MENRLQQSIKRVVKLYLECEDKKLKIEVGKLMSAKEKVHG